MSSQAENLQQLVGFFKVGGSTAVAHVPANRPAAVSVARPAAARMASSSQVDESSFQRF
jgi:hypothetical protein